MRMSCNGCRVLRKGCSEDCSIKPCLQWIKNPESQANATVFLAKFYGRAGLMNLINAGPEHLRPAIFRSLLYEACGRIVNPIYGSVGLLWSGNWQLCQNAVEAVLKGAPITQIASEAAETNNGPPLKAYDIRHVNKEEKEKLSGSNDPHRVRTRCRFKRSGLKSKDKRVRVGSGNHSSHEEVNRSSINEEVNRSSSHDSSLSHQSEEGAPNAEERESRDSESLVSVETAEAEAVVRPEPESFCKDNQRAEDGEIELELTLGFEPFSLRAQNAKLKQMKRRVAPGFDNNGDKMCKMELGLDYPA